MKKTKQGVRDLNDLGSKKSKGIRLEMPPAPMMCRHQYEQYGDFFLKCKKCGQCIDDPSWGGR